MDNKDTRPNIPQWISDYAYIIAIKEVKTPLARGVYINKRYILLKLNN